MRSGVGIIHPVNEDQTRFTRIPRGINDGIEYLVCVPGIDDRSIPGVDQIIIGSSLHRVHEVICRCNRKVEIVQFLHVALHINEFFNVGMIDSQHRHVGSPSNTSLLYGFCCLIKNRHE